MLQTVHGAVMVIVDIVVRVLTAVIVTGTAEGVLVTVMTEPLPFVVVVVTGGGVELVTIGATGVLPEEVVDDETTEEEVLEEDGAVELECVRSIAFAVVEAVEVFGFKLISGLLELLEDPHGKVTVLVTVEVAEGAFVTVTVAVGEQT